MKLLTTFGMAVALTLSNASSFALTAEQVYQRNQNSVVTIYSSAKGESQGSGVVVEVNARRALVTTNCHVVEGAATVSIVALGRRMSGDVLTCDKRADVALVGVSVAGLKPALMRDGPVPVGAMVYAIGTPRGLEKSISQGIVSQIRATPDGDRLQTTAPIEPGSSGGGLFDAQGRLIGITTSQISGSQALNFAIPLSEVLLRVRQMGAAQQTPKRQGILGKLDIKDFALGLHCTEVRDAIRRLEEEGLLPPKRDQQFCAASDLEGQSVWARFLVERGNTERKAMFTVSTDDQGFIESVHYLDVWFHNARQAPPEVGALLSAVRRKYGEATAVIKQESRNPAFFGPAFDSKVQVHIYTADPISKDLLAQLQSSSSSAVEARMKEHLGEYVIVEVSENSSVTGEPVSVSLDMVLKRGSKPDAPSKDLRL